MKICLLIFASLLSFSLSAQNVVLSGRVTNDKGTGIIGATISLKNTNYHTLCDSAGNYRIAGIAPGNYTLVAASIGFTEQSQAIELSVDKKIDIQLQPSIQQLKEVNVNDKAKTSGICN